MPTSGVEMPDDSVAKLDVQFGGLEFGTGSTFNSVVQHGVPKGAGDMMYSSSVQQQKMDTYSVAGSGEADIQSKNIASAQASESFQGQRSTQQNVSSSLVGANDQLNSKNVQMSPSNADAHVLSSSIASQQPKNVGNSGAKPSIQQQSYTNSSNNSGSAFVSYPGKGAPGFPAPGFPPVSQSVGKPFELLELERLECQCFSKCLRY